MKVYNLFLQQILKIAIVFIRIYWKIFAPSTVGVKILIQRDDSKFLLVRHSYKKGWYLAGGGLKKYENASKAAAREALEEIGIDIENMKFLGLYRAVEDYKNDWILAFYTKVQNVQEIVIDDIEIVEYKWVNFDELDNLSLNRRSRRIIKDFMKNGVGYHFDI